MSTIRLFCAALFLVTVLLFAGSKLLMGELRRSPALHSSVEDAARSSIALVQPAYSLVESFQYSFGHARKSFADGLSQLHDSLFTLQLTEVRDNYYISDAQLNTLGRFDTAPTIFDMGIDARLKLIQAHPWIEAAAFSWQILPLRLVLQVQEAEPWIVAEYSGHSWLLSRNRRLLSPLAVLSGRDLVEISSSRGRIDGLADQPGIENYLSSENARLDYATKMVELLELAQVFPYEIDRYTLAADGSLIVSPRPPSDKPLVRLRLHTLAESQFAAQQLAGVLGDLELRQEKAKEIDLRFPPQIIVR